MSLVVAVGAAGVVSGGPAPVPSHPLTWGVYEPASGTQSLVDNISALRDGMATAPTYVHRFVALGDTVPIADLDAIAASGSTAIITIEPWQAGKGVEQPRFALQRIADGDFDADFQRWGRHLGTRSETVLVRFAHEMNGDWYPWSVGVNGNTPGAYVAAWQRMRHIVHDLARNVQFVWAPNSVAGGINTFEAMYPGSHLVDVLGLDGYNWGDDDEHQWRSPDELFSESVARLRALPGEQPILITEVASAEDPVDPERKARWITDLFGLAATWPDVEALVWFDEDKERNWRFASSPQAHAAFRDAVYRRTQLHTSS